MSGPNYLLDKGFLVDAAATNVEHGRFAKFLAADTTGKKITTATAPTSGAAILAAEFAVGVYQDTIDAAKIATGKCVTNIRMLGISRVIAGGTVVIGDRITTDATGRGIAVGAVTAGHSKPIAGIALTPATVGTYFNCLLTPGAGVTNGGT
jgi:hypothetical protein